jgi:hypothetical protein
MIVAVVAKRRSNRKMCREVGNAGKAAMTGFL